MNSPDNPERIDQLSDAMAYLLQAMRLMDANSEQRDQWMLESDARIQESLRELATHSQEHAARIRENQERIRDILAILTRMQADLARLDS